MSSNIKMLLKLFSKTIVLCFVHTDKSYNCVYIIYSVGRTCVFFLCIIVHLDAISCYQTNSFSAILPGVQT